jgi:hypothetical protein
MKRASTHFLRLAISLMGLIVLALCIFALPSMWKGGSEEFPMASKAIFVIIINMYLTAIPFFFALWQTFKLLHYIDHNKTFSQMSVTALKNIKYCAIIITALYVVNVPLLFPIAEADDAPGLIIFGMLFACAPLVIAVFAATLQKLLQNAIEIKTENDLTV